MKVIAIDETFIDGESVNHCCLLIFKKTTRDHNETWSLSLLLDVENDITQDSMLQNLTFFPDDVNKIFHSEEEFMVGIVFSSNSEKGYMPSKRFNVILLILTYHLLNITLYVAVLVVNGCMTVRNHVLMRLISSVTIGIISI